MDEFQIKKTLRHQGSVEAEILKEMAEALGNSGERVERALEKLGQISARIQEMRRSLAALDDGPKRDSSLYLLEKEIEAYNSLRRNAMEQLRWLIIHREALGIRNHAHVAEQYRIPPPMRL